MNASYDKFSFMQFLQGIVVFTPKSSVWKILGINA